MLIEEYKPLAPLTTIGIGGPARWFVEAASEEEIAEAAAWAQKSGVQLFALGGGSNLLVSDTGFDGMVLRIRLRGIAKIDAPDSSGHKIYQAAAGEEWEHCVQQTIEDGCAGIECLAGIPGTVGGTPVQNIGAYGQEAATVIERVRAYDLRERRFVEFTAAQCGFAYRRSRFNSDDRGRHIITRVDYRLIPGGAPALRYAELQRNFPEGVQPSLAEVAAQVRRIRQVKGMLLVAGDPNCHSAGSFFKNPMISEKQFRQITAVGEMSPPCFPATQDGENQGKVKIPAAWLIEQAGFSKGYALGKAAISSRHTLALVNRGGASAADVLALAGLITDAVVKRFGIRLETEPVMLGF